MGKPTTIEEAESNKLFPVFLKLEQLRMLLVGGGSIGLEKLTAILHNSPATRVKVVATVMRDEIRQLVAGHPQVQLLERPYETTDLEEADVVIIAINDRSVSETIAREARAKGKLVNVADTPELCDFYLGSIVKKGNLKIAISTNGKSPTIARRLREVFAEALPDRIDDVLQNMQIIRSKLNGDLSARIDKLNEITRVLATDEKDRWRISEKRWKRMATYALFAFFFMFMGGLVMSYIPFHDILGGLRDMTKDLDSDFYWMILAGFLAQLVDGALGMGYGVTCTTVLLSIGISLPAISGSIHTAEMFSSGVSGYSHYKFGNINKRLFKVLVIPGVLGAIGGAYVLSRFGNEYADYVRPILASYTMFLGIKIIRAAFLRNKKQKKVKRVGWLAGAGGFLDSFGGGGWGPLVTSSLISKGRSPRYVIGSVSLTEFFVTLASALTFFSLLGVSYWQVIIGLIIGGTVAAPIAARLAGKLPLKTMFISVGILVMIWSLRILIMSLGNF